VTSDQAPDDGQVIADGELATGASGLRLEAVHGDAP
jgi:hypothetical protein